MNRAGIGRVDENFDLLIHIHTPFESLASANNFGRVRHRADRHVPLCPHHAQQVDAKRVRQLAEPSATFKSDLIPFIVISGIPMTNDPLLVNLLTPILVLVILFAR